MRNNEYAVSAVVSAILALMLVTSVSGTILLWGVPYTDTIKGKAVLESIFNQLSVASELTRDMIQESAGSARQYNLLIQGGQIHINSTGDRLIVMFSLNPAVNFYAIGLDDNDGAIRIQGPGAAAIQWARAYWFSTEPSDTTPQTPLGGPPIDYTAVIFDVSTVIPGETYKYQLVGYNDDFTSYTNSSTITYYDLPDNDSYRFEAREKEGGSFRRIFQVIEGHDPLLIEMKQDILLPLDFPFSNGLVGTVRIDLMDGAFDLLGKVYIFDLGFVECKIQNTAGDFRKIWENNGILSIDSNENFVNREPMISSQGDMFALRVMQLRSLESTVVGGTFAEAKLGVYLVENYIREMLTEAYNVKIQIYGSYSDIWLEYFRNIHGFTDHTELNTLEHPAGVNPIDLLLSQSLCNAYLG